LKVVARKDEHWCIWENPVHIWQAFDVKELQIALQKAQAWALENGGELAGYLSYEAAPAFDRAMVVRNTGGRNDGSIPLLCLGGFLESRTLSGFAVPGWDDDSATTDSYERLAIPESELGRLACGMLNDMQADLNCEEYVQAVQNIRDAEKHGRCYQVNYTWNLMSDLHTETDIQRQDQVIRYIAQHILNETTAPYAAWIEFDRVRIASASPELFFAVKDQQITLRPMKGTAPRSKDPKHDQHNKALLESSQKERAENLMITDMIRNDVGRIAVAGSVHAPELFSIEKYPTVWQMTSTVKASLPGTPEHGSIPHLSEILQALFPCASITGAPKIEAMKIIAQTEKNERGVYTGAIGYWDATSGDALFSVAIRTLEAKLIPVSQVSEGSSEPFVLKYGTGSGVVWDSRPVREWRECWYKTRVLKEPIALGAPFEILESLLACPLDFDANSLVQGGTFPGFSEMSDAKYWLHTDHCKIFLGTQHLQRMKYSAGELGFEFDMTRVMSQLEKSLAQQKDIFQSSSFVKLRLLLEPDGVLRTECHALESSYKVQELKAFIANTPCDSSDWRLHHKTTARAVYDHRWNEVVQSARRDDSKGGFRQPADEVLLFNQHEEITETRFGNLVYKLSGQEGWFTPPWTCGLLNGTLRQCMLDQGLLKERVLTYKELTADGGAFQVEEIWRINSVSGMQRIILMDDFARNENMNQVGEVP